jgi:hypothetical protein
MPWSRTGLGRRATTPLSRQRDAIPYRPRARRQWLRRGGAELSSKKVRIRNFRCPLSIDVELDSPNALFAAIGAASDNLRCDCRDTTQFDLCVPVPRVLYEEFCGAGAMRI